MGRTTIRESVREEVDERGRAAGTFSGMRVGASQMATTKENGRKYCRRRCLTERERAGERFKCFSIRGDFIKAEIPARGLRRGRCSSVRWPRPEEERCVVNRAKAWKGIEKEDTTQVEKRRKMGDERKVKEGRLGEEESCTMETEEKKEKEEENSREGKREDDGAEWESFVQGSEKETGSWLRRRIYPPWENLGARRR